MAQSLINDTYKTLASFSQGFYKDKGSRFIALAHPVQSEEQVLDILQSIKKEYHDARHHCYAYRLGPEGEHFRMQDDGEPSGTAGKPIHGQLLSFGLTNTLIVVVRYFGGIKLGTGGLITAYRASARDALQNADIKECTVNASLRISFSYPQMNDVMRLLKDAGADTINTDFQLECRIDVSIRLKDLESLKGKLSGLQGVAITDMP